MDLNKIVKEVAPDTDYGTIGENGAKMYISPKEQAKQNRMLIYQAKNTIIAKRKYIRKFSYFLIFIGICGFFKQIFDILIAEPEKVVIEADSFREEIDISQGFLFGERILIAIRDLLFMFQGWYYLRKLKQPQNLKASQKLITTTIIIIIIQFAVFSLQYYLSCYLIQDVVRTWQQSLSSSTYHQKSKSGTFSYTRTKIGTGYIGQEMDVFEEADIYLIAFGMILLFFCILGLSSLICFGILKYLLSYKQQFVNLECLNSLPNSIELQTRSIPLEEVDEHSRLAKNLPQASP
ncbi:unnamed protein product [Moneuplotes crassus]|uniref:Transmembrane protein n=1 Tax=Euplotes crassus TaxID=5936 RepID=A0AAD1XQU3_EUPCR|nr:unnamed protein product [Moneuplotes crassus]